MHLLYIGGLMGKLRKKPYLNLTLAFMIPCVFLLIIFIAKGITPFGNNTIIRDDLQNQYIALFSYFKQNILHPTNFLYSTSLTLGGNFYGVFTYYLCNPLNLLSLLFKQSQLPVFFTFFTILKVSLVGLTMFIFLDKSRIINGRLTNENTDSHFGYLIFSTSFALMSFVFLYKDCVMWLDAVYLLPLVILGLERILYEHRIRLFTISLTVAIIVNYYMGYMIGFFTGILVFGSFIFLMTDKKNKMAFKFIIEYIKAVAISVGLSCFILIPSYLSTSGVQKDSTLNGKPLYTAIVFVGQMFKENTISNTSNYPMLYSGAVTLFFFVLFFFLKKVTFKVKIFGFFGTFVMFIFSWVNAFYTGWHAFAYPNGYLQRESYMIVFMIVCIATIAYNVEKVQVSEIFSTLLTLIVLEFAVKQIVNLSFKYTLLFGLLLFLIAIIVYLYKNALIKFGTTVLLFVSLLSLFIIDYKVQSIQVTEGLNASSFKSYINSVKNKIPRETSKKFYRIGNNFQLSSNDPLLLNYSGVSNYVSQQGTYLTDYMSALGFYQKHSWNRWANYNGGSTGSMNKLFGIRYTISSANKSFGSVIASTNSVMKADSKDSNLDTDRSTKTDGSVKTIEDKSVFGLITKIANNSSTHRYISYNPTKNPFDNQNRIWWDTFHVSSVYTKSSLKNLGAGKFSFVSQQEGKSYIYLPQSRDDLGHATKIYLDGSLIKVSNKNSEAENGVISLGSLTSNQTHEITLKDVKNNYITDIIPVVETEDSNKMNQISKEQNSTRVGSEKVKGNKVVFTTKKSSIGGNFLISLPYDKHWSARIDGKKVKIHRAASELLALKIPSGKHTVRMIYHVPGLSVGTLITVVTVLLTLLFVLHKTRLKKERLKEVES